MDVEFLCCVRFSFKPRRGATGGGQSAAGIFVHRRHGAAIHAVNTAGGRCTGLHFGARAVTTCPLRRTRPAPASPAFVPTVAIFWKWRSYCGHTARSSLTAKSAENAKTDFRFFRTKPSFAFSAFFAVRDASSPGMDRQADAPLAASQARRSRRTHRRGHPFPPRRKGPLPGRGASASWPCFRPTRKSGSHTAPRRPGCAPARTGGISRQKLLFGAGSDGTPTVTDAPRKRGTTVRRHPGGNASAGSPPGNSPSVQLYLPCARTQHPRRPPCGRFWRMAGPPGHPPRGCPMPLSVGATPRGRPCRRAESADAACPARPAGRNGFRGAAASGKNKVHCIIGGASHVRPATLCSAP